MIMGLELCMNWRRSTVVSAIREALSDLHLRTGVQGG
jgi:hypothetical protein